MIGDADPPGPDSESATAAAANLKRQARAADTFGLTRARGPADRRRDRPAPGEPSVGCWRIATPLFWVQSPTVAARVRVVIGPALQRPGPAQPGPARGYGYLWRALMERAPTAPT